MSKERKKSSIKLSALDADLLTVLRYGHEFYGLEILDELNQGRPIEIGFGSLYPALNRLEKKGLISWKWGGEQDQSGGARRKYYKINGLGMTVIDEFQEYRMQLINRSKQGKPALGGT